MVTTILQDFSSSSLWYGNCHFTKLLIISAIWWLPFCVTFHHHLCDVATAISLHFLSPLWYGDPHFAGLLIISGMVTANSLHLWWSLQYGHCHFRAFFIITIIWQPPFCRVSWYGGSHFTASHISTVIQQLTFHNTFHLWETLKSAAQWRIPFRRFRVTVFYLPLSNILESSSDFYLQAAGYNPTQSLWVAVIQWSC